MSTLLPRGHNAILEYVTVKIKRRIGCYQALENAAAGFYKGKYVALSDGCPS